MKMKYRYRFFMLLAAFLLFPLALGAQSWQWVRDGGGSGNDMIGGTAVDSAGNTYVTGTFVGNIVFNTTVFTNGARTGIFIAKYNPAGVLQWATSGVGTGDFTEPTLTVSRRGDIYLTGSFNGMVRFGTDTLRSSGGFDAFVAGFSTAGVLRWARSTGDGVGNTFARGVAIDSIGSLFVTGSFADTARFDTTTLQSVGMNDIFVARYDVGGAFRWAVSAGGADNDESYSIGADRIGNSYIAGEFRDSAFYGTDTIVTMGDDTDASNEPDAFVARFNPFGTPIWATSIGGDTADRAWDLAVDPAGNSYVVGEFSTTATVDTLTIESAGGTDLFIVKFDGVGQARWAVGDGGPYNDAALAVTIDDRGSIYTTGRYIDTATFGNVTFADSARNGDIFVVKYTGSGAFEWVRTAGGPLADEGRGIGFHWGTGELRVTGAFSGTSIFGNISRTSTGQRDAFIAKLGADPTINLGGIFETDFCPGDQFQIPFLTAGVFESGNVFTAQLSDSNGSFENPIEIGRVFGVGGTTIIGKIPDTALAGTGYRVRVVSSAPMVQSAPNQRDLQIHALPIAVVTPLGPTTFCRGGSVILDAGPGFGSYVWNNGEVTRTILVTRSGQYAVTVANARGCSSTSTLVPITVNVPVKPVITRTGMMLESTPAVSYQWLYNGAQISGATNRTHTPTQEGTYAILTVDSNGCEGTSEPFQFMFASVPGEGDARALSIYPHPNRGIFTVDLTLDRPAMVRLSVLNALGQQVWQNEELSAEGIYRRQVDLAGLPSGLYFVRIESANQQWVREVIKQ